jgi:hypothetical protein
MAGGMTLAFVQIAMLIKTDDLRDIPPPGREASVASSKVYESGRGEAAAVGTASASIMGPSGMRREQTVRSSSQQCRLLLVV